MCFTPYITDAYLYLFHLIQTSFEKKLASHSILVSFAKICFHVLLFLWLTGLKEINLFTSPNLCSFAIAFEDYFRCGCFNIPNIRAILNTDVSYRQQCISSLLTIIRLSSWMLVRLYFMSWRKLYICILSQLDCTNNVRATTENKSGSNSYNSCKESSFLTCLKGLTCYCKH